MTYDVLSIFIFEVNVECLFNKSYNIIQYKYNHFKSQIIQNIMLIQIWNVFQFNVLSDMNSSKTSVNVILEFNNIK